ncbi:hypothetical protein [Neorhizobium sp. P12A]|uniref:hypothetical protein n=1 Tax=Neorhizobium sp. P12A TaxID=2268027 RepID=UPI001AEEC4A1|nr:hypothetical protein [Neorhizobium sp. P12A]
MRKLDDHDGVTLVHHGNEATWQDQAPARISERYFHRPHVVAERLARRPRAALEDLSRVGAIMRWRIANYFDAKRGAKK